MHTCASCRGSSRSGGGGGGSSSGRASLATSVHACEPRVPQGLAGGQPLLGVIVQHGEEQVQAFCILGEAGNHLQGGQGGQEAARGCGVGGRGRGGGEPLVGGLMMCAGSGSRDTGIVIDVMVSGSK